MFSKEAGTAQDYHELNAGAHRKPPKILAAPSLVWHLAFWTKFEEIDKHGEPLKNDDGTPKKKTPDEVKDTLDNYIRALREAIIENADVDANFRSTGNGGVDKKTSKVELTPCISGTCLLFGNAYCEDSFQRVEFENLNPRQQDIFRSTTRAFSLQFIWKQLDVTIRFEIHNEYFSISTFVELDKTRKKAETNAPYVGVDGLDENIKAILGYLQPDAQVFREAAPPSSPDDKLPEKINGYFFHQFWAEYAANVLSTDSLKEMVAEGIFAQIFADFRGFVMSDQAVPFPDGPFFEWDCPPTWGNDAKGKFLPLIQHRNRELHSRYECAVNYMLDGRALYMSTLGPQLPSTPSEQRIPVEFIVYAHQRYNHKTIVNKWQLGRLVNQILLLGTFRLCALKDVKSLHEAGQLLGLLEETTQSAREAIAAIEAKASVSDENVMELIGKAHKGLNDITGEFLRKTGSGLLYRIERSRYYVKQFDDNVKLLRIKRVEGDQPYDQFIKRRLGSEFDFIDRLGIRYERATRNMVTLDQNYLAITQNALVEKANRIDEETNSIQSDIHTIQEWGELFLLGALVPYYVTHLFVLIFGEELSFIIAVNVWIVFAAAAIIRNYKIWEKIRERFSRGFIALAVVVGLIAGALVMPPFEMMLMDRQHERYEQKLTESVERQVGVLKRLLETQQRSGDGSKVAPPIGQVVPGSQSVVPLVRPTSPPSESTPRAPDGTAPTTEPAIPAPDSQAPNKEVQDK